MKAIGKKLLAVAKEIGYIQKDAKNDFHKYTYASAEKVLGRARESFARHGLVMAGSQARIVRMSDDMKSAVASVTLRIVDTESAEEIQVSGLGQGSDKGDKAVMKAVTAAVKYALSTGFLISWGDDPEADSGVDWQAFQAEVEARLAATSAVDELNAIGNEMKRRFARTRPPASVRDQLRRSYEGARMRIQGAKESSTDHQLGS